MGWLLVLIIVAFVVMANAGNVLRHGRKARQPMQRPPQRARIAPPAPRAAPRAPVDSLPHGAPPARLLPEAAERTRPRPVQATPVARGPARTRAEPTQAPRSGSTAITTTALGSVLFTPYQPSSLITSSSSSLSSSLFDVAAAPPPSWSALEPLTVVTLPTELEEQVIVLIGDGRELEAVRIVVDTMSIGIPQAVKTVRSYAARAR